MLLFYSSFVIAVINNNSNILQGIVVVFVIVDCGSGNIHVYIYHVIYSL